MSGYNRPIRVGLIIDEFFGGYGFLARNHIAK
ncbi:glycosyl transferase, partial [Acinetobacter baumannii]